MKFAVAYSVDSNVWKSGSVRGSFVKDDVCPSGFDPEYEDGDFGIHYCVELISTEPKLADHQEPHTVERAPLSGLCKVQYI